MTRGVCDREQALTGQLGRGLVGRPGRGCLMGDPWKRGCIWQPGSPTNTTPPFPSALRSAPQPFFLCGCPALLCPATSTLRASCIPFGGADVWSVSVVSWLHCPIHPIRPIGSRVPHLQIVLLGTAASAANGEIELNRESPARRRLAIVSGGFCSRLSSLRCSEAGRPARSPLSASIAPMTTP